MTSIARLGHILSLRKDDVTRRIKWLVVVLALLDVLLLVANLTYHLVTGTGRDGTLVDLFSWEKWYGEADGSVIELTGHVKLLVASVMLFVVAGRAGRLVYAVWGAILVAIALDDFLQLHERAGELLTAWTGSWSVLGLGSQSMGELIFWLLIAAPLGLWLLRCHFAAGAPARRDSYLMLASTVLLVIFAVGVDTLISIIGSDVGYIGYQLLNFLETTGELIGMSAILIASAIVLVRRSQRSIS